VLVLDVVGAGPNTFHPLLLVLVLGAVPNGLGAMLVLFEGVKPLPVKPLPAKPLGLNVHAGANKPAPPPPALPPMPALLLLPLDPHDVESQVALGVLVIVVGVGFGLNQRERLMNSDTCESCESCSLATYSAILAR
jgi:hypothetical protein